MLFEVEKKFAVADRGNLERRLLEIGACPLSSERQIDCYLRHPQRDFAVTDEALRIRQTNHGLLVTYKGPRAPGDVKIREEIELPFQPGASLDSVQGLFERLGFRVIAEVRKQRVVYELKSDRRPILICCDRVEDLGEFVEIELMSETSELNQATAAVTAVAQQLGLSSAITASYLKMLLEQRTTLVPETA